MTSAPYLSIVAAARNDNHGGNMLRRMQIFVNGVITQAHRYQVPVELIIVEWNPPADKPKLSKALTWNVGDSPCVVRIIEVPNELHRRLRHSQSLPLFQMIAKNVGIRRATGEFILATNIDLLFSDALFEFLASRQLEPKKSYRVDRYDVASDVPLEGSIEDQLAYCDRSIIRVNHKDGIEERLIETPDIEPVPHSAIALSPPPKWYEKVPESSLPNLAKLRQIYKRVLPTLVRNTILSSLPKDFQSWLVERSLLTAKPLLIAPEPAVENTPQPPAQPLPYAKLHTITCGDFTLLSKVDWFAIRGYPEWEMYSLHLDSILLYTVHYAGITEEILGDDMRAYHIEHSSGWTPEIERSQVLDNRLSFLGIPKLSLEQLDAIARLMEQIGKPLLFNDENWGLNQHSFQKPSLPQLSYNTNVWCQAIVVPKSCMKTEFRDDQYHLSYPDGVENHWWHLARNRLIEQKIRQLSKQDAAILDVGCGRGVTVKYLRSKAIDCVGVEPAEACPFEQIEQYIFAEKKAEDLSEIDRNRYSLILLLDVVEHITNPETFLKDLTALFPNLTHVLITVPACPELWSNYDEFYGHHRRYTISMIKSLSQQLDWQLVWNFYFFQLLYLPARIITKTGQQREVEMMAPKGIGKWMHWLVSYALTIGNNSRFLGFPGTSIIACFALSKY